MRTFRRTASMPAHEIRRGPGGAAYIVLASTGGLDVYVELDDAVARGWLEEVPREELLAKARAVVADLERDPFA